MQTEEVGVLVIGGFPYTVVVWRCCRPWPIVLGWPVRRCGLCGERPQP